MLSMPRPTVIPPRRNSPTGAMRPRTAFMSGQWATAVRVAARSAVSGSSMTEQSAAAPSGASRPRARGVGGAEVGRREAVRPSVFERPDAVEAADGDPFARAPPEMDAEAEPEA